jgi:hypothetical protein
MALGMALLRAAAGLQPLLWAAFAALTALHVWANVRAMRCLCIASLNQARCGLLLRHYLSQVGAALGAVCLHWRVGGWVGRGGVCTVWASAGLPASAESVC